MNDINKDTVTSEDCRAELAQVKSQFNNCNELIKELVALLEYEEALTVDTRSQQRMSNKLIELGLWPRT